MMKSVPRQMKESDPLEGGRIFDLFQGISQEMLCREVIVLAVIALILSVLVSRQRFNRTAFV